METVQQNGRFTLFPSKFHSNIYSILFGCRSTAHSVVLVHSTAYSSVHSTEYTLHSDYTLHEYNVQYCIVHSMRIKSLPYIFHSLFELDSQQANCLDV